MADNLRTMTNRAKDLGVPEKKLEDAVKAAGIKSDAKRATKWPVRLNGNSRSRLKRLDFYNLEAF